MAIDGAQVGGSTDGGGCSGFEGVLAREWDGVRSASCKA
jgi:hypothetical protein